MFKKYQHIERLGTDEVEDIETGKCYVFPKLDGTNASVWWHEGEIRAGSRNRLLSAESDNAGFYAWVQQQQDLKQFLCNSPNLRLYGEWLKPHTLKTYRDEAWNNFYIFDVEDMSNDRLIPFEKYVDFLIGTNLSWINPMAIITNPTEEFLYSLLEKNTYLIKDGQGVGEGIVVKRYDFQNKYGRQVWAKLVRNEFKDSNKRVFGTTEQITKSLEYAIVEKFCSEALINKALMKLKADEGITAPGILIPRLLSTVYHDFVTEELWAIVKEYKNPTIDFKTLYRTVVVKIKATIPQLF